MRCNYLKNKKLFLNFFLQFWKADKILNTFRKRMTLIADIFFPENVNRRMSKKSRFRGPFDKQHGKWDQTALKSEWHHFNHICWSLWRKLTWKKSLLVICKIFGLFVNTLTAGHKFFLLNRDKLTQSIQIQLSKKQKAFYQLFVAFLKCR